MRVDYCILVTISRETISFRYNRADGDNRFVDFLQDGEGEMPFAIECVGNEFVIGKSALDAAKKHLAPYAFSDIFDTCKSGRTFRYANRDEPLNKLPYYAIKYYIGKILSDCFYGVKGTLESNVARLPLVLLFAPELDTDKQLFIRCPFEEGGFQNVCSIGYHQLLMPIVMANIRDKQKTKAVVMASVDKEDLLLQLYDTADYQPLGEVIRVISQGCDPRIGQVADLIWECLLGYNYQPREPEEGILREAAERFLRSDAMSENDVLCMSDGSMQPYMISRASLVNTSSGNSSRIINHELEVELARRGLLMSQCQVVLVGKAATDYFESIFNQNPMAGPVKKVTSKEKVKMLDYLLEKVKGADYVVRNIWPTFSTKSYQDKKPLLKEETSSNFEADHRETCSVDTTTDLARVRKYKRRVEVVKKEVAAILAEGNVADARRKLTSLLDQLHNDGVHAFDEELVSLIEAPSTNHAKQKDAESVAEPTQQAEKEPRVSVKSALSRWSARMIRQKLAPLREQMNENYTSAYKTFETLKRQAELLDSQSLKEKMDEFAELFKQAKQANSDMNKDKADVATDRSTRPTAKIREEHVSEAETLLKQGKYLEAKRVYALEHNSQMAEMCSKLIRGHNYVERVIQPELDLVKVSHNVGKAQSYLEELIKLRDTMKQVELGLNTSTIDLLIKEYQKIK